MLRPKWLVPRGAQSSVVANASTNEAPPAPIPPSTADAKHFGLENFGNTCYANSVLQALYFCAPFRELLIQTTDSSVPDEPTLVPASVPPLPSAAQPQPPVVKRRPTRSGSVLEPEPAPMPPVPGTIPIPTQPPTLFSALRSLFVHIAAHPADKGTVAPRAFVDKLKAANELFRSTQQQDAHEFFNFVLNTVADEIRRKRRDEKANASAGAASSTIMAMSAGGEEETLVSQLFEGVLTSETRCLTCETVSSRDETFLDLSVDIEQNSSITACLRQFSASEMLCQRNKFFCDACCDLQEAEKRMKIKTLPHVLALHLKRFKYQEDTGRYVKLAYRVAFPLELRLFNTVDDARDPDRLYELFSIVVHIGSGPNQGHYVTVVRTGGGWLLCDDTSTEVLKEADLPRYFGNAPAGSAYVLYYQAADLDRAALGLPPLPSPKAAAASMRPSTSLSGGSDGPALPPGLSADLEDEPRLGPAPYTPLPPVSSVPGPPSLPTVQPTTVPIPSTPAPPLHIAVPPPDPTAVPAPGARTPGLGLIGRLRGEKSTSALAPITVPATPAGSSVAGGALEPPTPTTSAHDGREPGTGLRPKPSTGKGDRDSKGGTWFVKRRSFRASSHAATAGPEPPLPPSPALPHALPPDAYAQTVGHSASPPSAQGITPPTPGTSQKWYRTASHGARPRAPHPGATLAGGAEANLPAAPSISASPAVSASASGSSNGAPPVPGESTSSSITDSGYDSGTIQPSVPAPTPLRQLPPLPGRTSVPPSPIRSRSRKDSASAGLPPPPPVPTYDPTNHASASLEAPPPMLTSASLTSLNGTSGTPPPRPARSPYREPAARESVAASPPLSPPTMHMQPGASYPFPGSHVPPTSRSGLEPERPQEAAGQASPLLEHKHSSQVIANGPRRGLSVDTHKRELPARPSSAGATLGTTPRRAHGADAPPVPPMPARDSQRGQPSPYGVGTDAETPPDERDDALGSMPSSSLSSSSAVPLPTSASAPSPVPPSAFTNGTPKRASRKLSLSGLFGKKDKDKERDRDRERRGTRDDPVLSFTSSMASASSRV